jgi:uncharacterized membrane protein
MEENQIKPQKPSNYLAWAIVTTILCCLPFGIVSIVYSTKVDGLYFNGQYEEAEAKSKEAKKWAIIAAIVGVVCYILYFAFVGVAAFEILKSKQAI